MRHEVFLCFYHIFSHKFSFPSKLWLNAVTKSAANDKLSLFLDREKHFWILKTLSKTSPFPKYFYNFIWALLFLEIRNERFMLGENIEKWPVELGANWFILGKNHELSQVFGVSATMGGWNKSQNILFAINLAPPFSLLWEKQIPFEEVFPDFSFPFSSFHF